MLTEVSLTPVYTQNVEEAASISLETQHTPDPYWFQILPDGRFYSPTASVLVEDVVDTRSYLGRVERRAFLGLQQSIRTNPRGVKIWVSPPHPDLYSDTKLVVSEVLERGRARILFNRAIILDIDQLQALKLAQGLSRFSSERWDYTSAEEVRGRVLSLDNAPIHWSYILEELVDLQGQGQMVRSGGDIMAKERALIQAEKFVPYLPSSMVLEEMRRRGMIGVFDPSCPISQKTAFSYMFENSLPVNRKDKTHPHYCVHCGACGEKIEWVVLPGEKCPDIEENGVLIKRSCGAVRKCA